MSKSDLHQSNSHQLSSKSTFDRIIRPKELATILGISISTLYRHMDELPPKVKLSKKGSAVGWRKSDIEKYIDQQTEG